MNCIKESVGAFQPRGNALLQNAHNMHGRFVAWKVSEISARSEATRASHNITVNIWRKDTRPSLINATGRIERILQPGLSKPPAIPCHCHHVILSSLTSRTKNMLPNVQELVSRAMCNVTVSTYWRVKQAVFSATQ